MGSTIHRYLPKICGRICRGQVSDADVDHQFPRKLHFPYYSFQLTTMAVPR